MFCRNKEKYRFRIWERYFFYLCGKFFPKKLKNAPYAVFMICKKKQRRPQGDRHIIAHTDTAFEDIAVAMNTKVFDTAIKRNAK